MRKGSDVVGKSVIAFDIGKRVAQIQDLIFDQHDNQLLGFLVQEAGLFRTAQVIPLNAVQSIGTHAVIIPSQDVIVAARSIPEIEQVLNREIALKGTRILTTAGQYLGSVVDLFFNEQTGNIEGYEASGGLFADAYSGRSFIPSPQTIKIGEEVTFVPPETAQLMEEQVGGIKAAVQTAGNQIQESSSLVGQKVQDGAKSASKQLQLATDSAGKRLQTASNGIKDGLENGEQQAEGRLQLTAQSADSALSGAMARLGVEQAQGRRALRMVRDSNGLIITAPGQIVTSVVVERAKAHRQEADLLAAVGLQPADAARSRANLAISDAGMQFREEAVAARENMHSLWQETKLKISEVQNRSAKVLQEKRIEQALGRPVTRVILDLQDQVILNVGELITHKAIRQAEAASVLNILLDSVYRKEPAILDSELRAPESGSASLVQERRFQLQS